MQTINGKEIKGFSCADGVHWYWGDKEVAVLMNPEKKLNGATGRLSFRKML